MLECVINISEGRRTDVVDAIAAAAGRDLLDVHRDPHHHRAVLTVVGEGAARDVARAAVERLDLTAHRGVHPRIGVLDVVPFVPLGPTTPADAVRAREAFMRWAADDLGLGSHRYGPLGSPTGPGTTWAEWPDQRTLPEVRRRAAEGARPDVGPAGPDPRRGAAAVGARPVLVAYNLWLAEPDLALARRIATAVRGPALRALGLPVGDRVQVSMNLVDPGELGPAQAWDAVAALAPVAGAELVGLVPAAVLEAIDPSRWERLDLSADRTIEARLARR